MDCGGMNFNMPHTNMMSCPPGADNRNTNLYNLLGPAPPTAGSNINSAAPLPQLPQLSVPLSLPSLITAPITTTPVSNTQTSNATTANVSTAVSAPTIAQYNKALNNQPVEKGAPANVVITSSDPLPNPNLLTNAQQPTLSVTIPSHHIKPSLVPTPEASVSNTNTNNAFAAGSSFFGNSTSTASSTFSFKPQIAAAAAAAAEKNNATSTNLAGNDTVLNKTNESFGSVDLNKTDPEAEYDPRPDFKPIIPLPDEIEVKTGEEEEEVMFCHRAKLFRFVDKEWKERGIGDIKILKSKNGSGSRILMRRDQTHKICANHKITADLIVNTIEKDPKAIIWAANDYADEKLQLEKFFVRFKLPETAKQFLEAFKKEIKEANSSEEMKPPASSSAPKAAGFTAPVVFGLAKSGVTNFATSTPAGKTEASNVMVKPNATASIATSSNSNSNSPAASKTLFAGLTTKPTTDKKPEEAPKPFANFSFDKSATTATSSPASSNSTTTTNSTKPFANLFGNLGKNTQSPFSTANLNFATVSSTPNTTNTTTTAAADSSTSALNKSQASDNEDEYVPTAQFNPVIPLPDLVEVTTGEENEIVLFEYRAKLLRFDKEAGEWKERGLGNIKLLQDKSDINKVRLVMRREQIHKLCCNQRIYKDTSFKYAKNSTTAVSWAGQDYSENELVTEMFTVRFKTAETCKEFLEAVKKAQNNMNDDKQTQDNEKKTADENKDKQPVKGFGDAFKPKAGSWSCSACYISNAADVLYCVACDTPKDDTVPKKEAPSILATTGNSTFTFGFAQPQTGAANASANQSSFTFGATIKPAAASSTTTNNNAVNTNSTSSTSNTTTTTSGFGFGDQFKPKAGSWSCPACYLSNKPEAIYCQACDAPKDDSIPKKETTNNILAPSNTAQKFTFGFGATTSLPASFGSLANTNAAASGDASKSFSFTPPSATSTSLAATAPSLAKPTFNFSLNSKAAEATSNTTTAAAVNANSPFSLDKKEFSFTLKPKSPGKSGKSPAKLGGGDADGDNADDDGGDYHEEEENNTYFTPVIPLPDKVSLNIVNK